MRKHQQTGFTLVELAVALMVMAILAAIAYPTYTSYITKNRRSDGQIAVMDLANRMEQYFSRNNTYVGATLSNLGMNTTSPQGFYTLSITSSTATAFTVQAAPTGAQASDTTCGNLTLNQLGQKGISGSSTVSNCW